MFIKTAAPGAIVVVDSDMVTCDTAVRDDVKVLSVPSLALAKEIGHKQGANIVMAGAILKATGDFTEEEGIKGMNDMFKKKGKEKYEEINTKAFKLGFNYI